MKKLIVVTIILALFTIATDVTADWQRSPGADADKEFISGGPGLQPGTPPSDRSCWLAASSNMLAAAGYGNGDTMQDRTEDIYLEMLTWQASIDATNPHGTKHGGWMDNALNWWLGSANNEWPSNPYTVVTVYGGTGCSPWSNTSGPRNIGNWIRDYKSVSLGIRWGYCSGGHAITPWGDSGTASTLFSNPSRIIVSDSDRDGGGDFQTYTYDDFTNPNPGGANAGNGWYFNFSTNHAYILQAVTLTPTDSPINPFDGPTQKVVGSYRIHQDELEHATDLHYNAWTDYDILGYNTTIDWDTSNDPVIVESDTHVPSLTRSDIHVDWDLSDNPVPYCRDVTITTEFILQNYNGIHYEDVYFTYPGAEDSKFAQPPYDETLGTDVRVDNFDGIERVLADDFLCTRKGMISKIYLWGSWNEDPGEGPAPGRVDTLHLRIFSDDPVGDDPDNPNDDPDNRYSKPLKLLWSESFEEFKASDYGFVPEEHFWDPYGDEPLSWDNRVWMYEIDIPEDIAFEQQGSQRDPKIYWLAVSAEISGESKPAFGWKTTKPDNGWNDAAVMYDPVKKVWRDLDHPAGHELQGTPIDLSFGVITPATEPGIIFPEFGWNIFTPELNEPQIPDVTGGFLIGAFDIYDYVGQPELLGQYRFVHQYPYNQDPEQHLFTLQGPEDQTGCEYVATNFRFGHSYGMPGAEELWQFNEWMSAPAREILLCGGQPVEIPLDWQGRLPYPASKIFPADQIPDPPDCSVYLEGDINKDCCVDFKDLSILAADWLQCTSD